MRRKEKVLMFFDNGLDRITVKGFKEYIEWFEVEHISHVDKNDGSLKKVFDFETADQEARELLEAVIYLEQEDACTTKQ